MVNNYKLIELLFCQFSVEPLHCFVGFKLRECGIFVPYKELLFSSLPEGAFFVHNHNIYRTVIVPVGLDNLGTVKGGGSDLFRHGFQEFDDLTVTVNPGFLSILLDGAVNLDLYLGGNFSPGVGCSRGACGG